MRLATPPMPISEAHREVLERLSRSGIASHREVARARALVLAADGVANTQIAETVGVSPTTVKAWRERFAQDGLKELGAVRPGRGRKATITDEKVAEIVRATLLETPPGETHWSCRSMAKAHGVSPATVQRIWSARGLQPHRVDTFKLSNDPRFEEKLVDVVGLYLNPPEKAVVLCMDEKSQIQALDRTQASLPMKKGRAGTMTHDYKRNGENDGLIWPHCDGFNWPHPRPMRDRRFELWVARAGGCGRDGFQDGVVRADQAGSRSGGLVDQGPGGAAWCSPAGGQGRVGVPGAGGEAGTGWAAGAEARCVSGVDRRVARS